MAGWGLIEARSISLKAGSCSGLILIASSLAFPAAAGRDHGKPVHSLTTGARAAPQAVEGARCQESALLSISWVAFGQQA